MHLSLHGGMGFISYSYSNPFSTVAVWRLAAVRVGELIK